MTDVVSHSTRIDVGATEPRFAVAYAHDGQPAVGVYLSKLGLTWPDCDDMPTVCLSGSLAEHRAWLQTYHDALAKAEGQLMQARFAKPFVYYAEDADDQRQELEFRGAFDDREEPNGSGG